MDHHNIKEFEVYHQHKATRRNPIFLYGPTRSGKTTVLKAIEDYLSEQRGVKVFRLDAEDLVIELVKNIRSTGNTEGFYHKFHGYDALLVDNIWILQGKPKTTEEIFLLFRTLIDKGKLLLIAWDIPPAALSVKTKAFTELHKRSITVKMKPYNPFFRLESMIRKLSNNKGVGG